MIIPHPRKTVLIGFALIIQIILLATGTWGSPLA